MSIVLVHGNQARKDSPMQNFKVTFNPNSKEIRNFKTLNKAKAHIETLGTAPEGWRFHTGIKNAKMAVRLVSASNRLPSPLHGAWLV